MATWSERRACWPSRSCSTRRRCSTSSTTNSTAASGMALCVRCSFVILVDLLCRVFFGQLSCSKSNQTSLFRSFAMPPQFKTCDIELALCCLPLSHTDTRCSCVTFIAILIYFIWRRAIRPLVCRLCDCRSRCVSFDAVFFCLASVESLDTWYVAVLGKHIN